jgi:hypothetical protein
MRHHGLWLVALLALPTPAQAGKAVPAQRVSGIVYLDADGDGRRERGDPPVADVKVSNGREVVATDARGRYAIEVRAGDTLFVIKPPGADLPRRADGLPEFWKHHFPSGSPPLRYGGIARSRIRSGDFALRPATRTHTQPLDVLVFGDPQPKRAVDVGYYERDIVEPLLGRVDAQVGLTLGDVADDDLSLYAGMNRVTARLGIPWLHVPGNHDVDYDVTRDEDSLLTYRRSFGPDTYAWEVGDAVFILLDDVIYQPGRTPAYVGGLRDAQLTFIRNYLATVPRTRRVILAAHIHLFDVRPGNEDFRRADRERLFALLQPFPNVLLLTAHGHVQRHYFHTAVDGWHGAQPLHEYNVGAACGGYWSGPFDAQGIPDARMVDGTPNGYARMRLDGTDYRLRWYNARDPLDERIGLHAPKVLRRGSYPGFAVIANVYMGMADTRVEYRIDDGPWQPMKRREALDPRLVDLNLTDDRSARLRSFDRAVGAEPSQHLWRGALPTDLSIGEHRVEVRAFDRWEGELTASTSYRLAEYPESP